MVFLIQRVLKTTQANVWYCCVFEAFEAETKLDFTCISTCLCFAATAGLVLVDVAFSFWANHNLHIFDTKKERNAFLSVSDVWTGQEPAEEQNRLRTGSLWAASLTFRWRKPCSCSGGTPQFAPEPSDPVIKETKVAGGSERARNVDTGGGVVFWSPTSTLKMNTLGVCRSLSKCLELLPFVFIVLWLNVIRCHDQRSEWTSRLMTDDADGAFISVKWLSPFKSFLRVLVH